MPAVLPPLAALFVPTLMLVSAGCPAETTVAAATDAPDAAGDADVASADVAPDTQAGPDPARFEGYCGADWEAVEARIDGLLEQMTLEQKLSQMAGSTPLPLDGVWETASIEELGIPGLRMLDGPRGVSSWAGPATAFPVGVARAATFDADLERRVGVAMARELRAYGANVILAPCINVLRHPRWGRSQETYGEDPWLLGEMGAAYVEGVQSQKVLATAKHYAVNSIDDTRFEVDVDIDLRSLREIYLPHFRRVVTKAHVAAIMSAYNLVNGAYCAENPLLLRDILKGDWGFLGLVMSDWFFGTRSTVESALAGLDIEMPAADFYGEPLVAAVQNGNVPMDVIDDAVRRVLRAQFCYELDSDPAVPDPAALETDETRALAREAARRSAVLLHNDGLLPLAGSSLANVVVVGALAAEENIGDTGSSNVEPSDVVTLLEGLEAALPASAVTHVSEFPFSSEDEAAIGAADAVFVVAGLTENEEGEGGIAAGDREELTLPAPQPEMIAATSALNSSTVALLMGGGALILDPWLDATAAALMVWYPGVEGGHAVADLVLGVENPSGRLPMVWPEAEADLPEFDNVSLNVTYDYWHGYRWQHRQNVTPKFPFGFGLSYTTFSYDAVRQTTSDDESLTFEVDITNTGAVGGIEVVQLYMEAPQSNNPERPVRELVSAAPVSVAPGATATATLTVDRRELAVFSTLQNFEWVTMPGTYVFAAGPHADSQPVSVDVEVF